jgi:tRNA 5-methylaminomethyl-2-thiouridine biosynthesis bifunctional protein
LTSQARHALVIGAGLAGAAVCVALARKGWHLTLLDAASGAALGASALPVGMLSPHVTRSPTPLSRLSERGVEVTRTELRTLVDQGAGWQDCEVDNLKHDAGRWPAALVRPSALVRAWLDEAARLTSLTTVWGARAHSLVRETDSPANTAAQNWMAVDAQGNVLAKAPMLVVAAAYGSHDLLVPKWVPAQAWPLRPVKGQMSLGALSGPPLAERPQRQNGVFVPCYEDNGLPPEWPARIWSMGSTYDRGDSSTHTTTEAHQRNADSLRAMHSGAFGAMLDAQASGQLHGWAQVRCASLDRLPLVGPVPDVAALEAMIAQTPGRRGRLTLSDVPRLPGLYTLSALGSRGLTLALPMAESLAQTLSDNASELTADLRGAVDPARFALRLARRQPNPASMSA